jgi:hypothetical protein
MNIIKNKDIRYYKILLLLVGEYIPFKSYFIYNYSA